MELALIVARQVAVVFLLILVGVIVKKKKMVTQEGIDQFTTLLLWFIAPAVLINAYQKELEMELVTGLLMAAIFAVLSHGAAILLSHLLFRKEPTKHYRIHIFCSVYSNCGYMAIPLLSAALGSDGVFYGSAYLAVFTLLYWTHGVYVYTGGDKKEISLKKALLNPGVVSTVISLILFFCQVKLPFIVLEPIKHLSNLNTPLSMIVLGSFLSNLNVKQVFKKKGLYVVCAMRLLVIPLISIGIAKLLQLDEIVAQAVMICTACPTAAVSTLFAHKYHLDADYSSEIVSVSTILSIATIPLMILLFQL
ncbi:MAG: AEC family transporter [Ruminococcaceae bacterium]|nr:AEC family transporter [Oscillospiraceae bacterium]